MRLLFIGNSSSGNPLRQALDVLFPRPLASKEMTCPCVLGAYAIIPLLSAGTKTVKHFVSRKNRSCGWKTKVADEVPVSRGDGIGMLGSLCVQQLKNGRKGLVRPSPPHASNLLLAVNGSASGALSNSPEAEEAIHTVDSLH
jgi:hypothetical protein